MKLLTIIVTYNGKKWMDRCLGSLRKSSLYTDILVVDNGSTDGTIEYIRSEFPEVQLHCAGENLGFGKANNIGLQKAVKEGYDYVYLLNQDAWVFPHTFERLIAAMEADPGYGILSPMQLTATEDKMDPRFVRWCPAAAWKEWMHIRSASETDNRSDGLSVEKYDANSDFDPVSVSDSDAVCGIVSESLPGEIHPVSFVMAAHWMISRACFCAVGGFSPAFPHYGEDDNYIHRAQYQGFKVGILSSAGAVHDREMRPASKEFRMRLKCVASVVKLSNPSNCFWFRCLFQPVMLLAISLRYGSWSVFKYIFTLVASYSRLHSIRQASLTSGAFLD
jgi:GT2 family glycosyltransferase